MRLSGVRVHYWLFESSLRADRAAHALAMGAGLFQQAIAVKDKVVLSGMRAGWHWVAEIGNRSAGSFGIVSAIPAHPAPQAGPPGMAAAEPFTWLPADASLRFDQRLRVDGKHVVQRIYRLADVPGGPGRVSAALTRSGWTRLAGSAATPGVQEWRRGADRLHVSIGTGGGAGSLFVQYVD